MTGALDGLRVLVVEDEPVVAMFLEAALAQLGCAVVGPAARIEDALAHAAGAGLDVALLDINLRQSAKSLPVAAALAARSVPFVLATGYLPESLPEDLRGRPFLLKPFGEVELAAALRRATGR